MTTFRRRASFVFQDMLPALTVEQNLVLPPRLAGHHADGKRAQAVLPAQFGLADRSHDRSEALPGGQRQRVTMARTFVTEPAVIFGDEPTGALDLRSARDALALLRSVVDQYGRTVVMVTHDSLAAPYADTVVSGGSLP
ncbi:ATP-binding cassette domain-containing protein [Micromonospora sp. NPDC005707]|uniref:ATP-binding cassette domain-containing protein n=1 Tax=Micromonospora sp. NPDC005707 TaxID=3157050 RepID=UPI0033D21BDA